MAWLLAALFSPTEMFTSTPELHLVDLQKKYIDHFLINKKCHTSLCDELVSREPAIFYDSRLIVSKVRLNCQSLDR